MTERTIKIKELISGQVDMGTFGLVELELLAIEIEIEELKTNNSKIIWGNACKAQMELVYEHCTHSPQGTNGHAIKHWVKEAEFKQD
jgi:hypothetical protein